MKKKNYFSWVNKRLGFFGLLVVLMWIKNMLAYTLDFHLSLENALQHFILIINPIATTLLLLSVGLYVRRKKASLYYNDGHLFYHDCPIVFECCLLSRIH